MRRAHALRFITPQTKQDITRIVTTLLSVGKRGPGGLGRAPRSLINALGNVIGGLGDLPSQSAANILGEDFWAKLITLHGLAVRELLLLTQQDDNNKIEKLQQLLSNILYVFIMVKPLEKVWSISFNIAHALLKTDTFHCYARLVASWKDTPPNSIDRNLGLLAQFSIIFSSTSQLAVSEKCEKASDPYGLGLYTTLLAALKSSQLLEHISQVLLRVQEATYHAVQDRQIRPTQAENLATGVAEICGCLVSALHGIAGKRGVMGSGLWHPPEPTEAAVQSLLPHVQQILGGPCLQFLLGRELIVGRLKFIDNGGGGDNGGDGPTATHGLPESFLPLNTILPPRPQPPHRRHLRNPPSTPRDDSADRLLSRLGAASLVWHLTAPRYTHITPYHSVNVYDMVYEALECVVTHTPASHLPGGDHLTLLEPTVLLARLIAELPPRVLVGGRLEGYWRVVVALLRRPELHVLYGHYQPMHVLGMVLQLELEEGGGEGALVGQQQQREEEEAKEVGNGEEGKEEEVEEKEEQKEEEKEEEEGAAEGEAAEGEEGGLQVVLDVSEDGAGDRAPSGSPRPPPAVPGPPLGPPLTLQLALDTGLLPAVEGLLRKWGRIDAPRRDNAASLVLTDAFLRRPGMWPGLLAHGSLLPAASLIATLRRLLSAVHLHMWAETLTWRIITGDTAFKLNIMECVAGLLEQCAAMVLLPPSSVAARRRQLVSEGASSAAADAQQPMYDAPLTLNRSLAHGTVGLLSMDWEVARYQLQQRVAAGSAAAQQLERLSIFCLLQWLPGALWHMLMPEADTGSECCAVLLRWTKEALRQCLLERQQHEKEEEEEKQEEEKEEEEKQEEEKEEEKEEEEKQEEGMAASSNQCCQHLDGCVKQEAPTNPPAATPPASTPTTADSPPSAAAHDHPLPADRAHGWNFFISQSLHLINWLGLFLRMVDLESGPEGPPSKEGAAASATVQQQGSPAASVEGPAAGAGEGMGGASAKLAAAAAGTAWSSMGRRPSDLGALIPIVFDVLELAAVAFPQEMKIRVRCGTGAEGGGPLGAGQGRGRAAAKARKGMAAAVWGCLGGVLHSARSSPCEETIGIVLSSGLLRRLALERRRKLWAVLNTWAVENIVKAESEGNSEASGGHTEFSGGSSAASPSASVSDSDCDVRNNGDGSGGEGGGGGQEQREESRRGDAALAALVSEVRSKYDMDSAVPLPSPAAVAQALAVAGVRLCGNPECDNMEGASELELCGIKTCARCRTVSYCSGACQLQHWRKAHQRECQGVAAAVSIGKGGLVAAVVSSRGGDGK